MSRKLNPENGRSARSSRRENSQREALRGFESCVSAGAAADRGPGVLAPLSVYSSGPGWMGIGSGEQKMPTVRPSSSWFWNTREQPRAVAFATDSTTCPPSTCE